jgi:hypothetical protein
LDWLVKPRPKVTIADLESERLKALARIKAWKKTRRAKRYWNRWHRKAIMATGKCRDCGQPRDINPRTGRLYYYCAACRAKWRPYMRGKMRQRAAAKNKVDLPKV